jgi:hypothetical protein
VIYSVEETKAIPKRSSVVRPVDKERLLSPLEVILGGLVGILRIPEDGINLAARQSSSDLTGS